MKTFLTLLVCCAALGCIPDHPCDADQLYRDGVCFEVVAPVPADAGAGADANDFSDYGNACLGPDDCNAPTDFCAIASGAASGYCTRTGCDVDPALCPPGWGCLDLSGAGVVLPSICTEPTP